MLGHDPLASAPLAGLAGPIAVSGTLTTVAAIFGWVDTSAAEGADVGGSGDQGWKKHLEDDFGVYKKEREQNLAKRRRDERARKAYEAKVQRAEDARKRAAKRRADKKREEAKYEKELAAAQAEGTRKLLDYVQEMRSIVETQRAQDEEDIIALLLAG